MQKCDAIFECISYENDRVAAENLKQNSLIFPQKIENHENSLKSVESKFNKQAKQCPLKFWPELAISCIP